MALSFSKNGLDLGVAFDGLAEKYTRVAFYNQGQQISLLPYSFMPGSGCVHQGPYERGGAGCDGTSSNDGFDKDASAMSSEVLRTVYSSYVSEQRARL